MEQQKAAPLPPARQPVIQEAGVQTLSSEDSSRTIIICMLSQTIHTLHIMNALTKMGVTSMAQRVGKTIQLFTPNWKVITKDQWVLNTFQGYTIDLVCQPHMVSPPLELRFPQTEVQKMIATQTVLQILRE